MGFETQREKLRLHLRRQLDDGEFTATEIARRVGVSQATITNFANDKRRISMKNADAIMHVLGISEQFLVDPPAVLHKPHGESIPVVRHTTAITVPFITRDLILRPSCLTTHDFRKFPARPAPDREHWTRFVAIIATRSQAKFLQFVVSDSAMLFIDRHDRQFELKTRPQSLYAVSRDGYLGIGYIELRERELMIHPFAGGFLPIHIPFNDKQDSSQLIVGRVSKVLYDPPKIQLR